LNGLCGGFTSDLTGMDDGEEPELRAAAGALPSLSAIAVELVYNSLDAGADSITVTFDLWRNQIRCRDNGHGIAPAILSTIFHHGKMYENQRNAFKRNRSTLAHMGHLADVVILTRTVNDQVSRRLFNQRSQYIPPLFAAGTEVVVSRAFAAIPSRMLEIATAAKKREESQKLLTILNTVMLNYAEISLAIESGPMKCDIKRSRHLEDRWKVITGTQLRMDTDGNFVQLKGTTSFPFSSVFQPFLVNGFPVAELIVDGREQRPIPNTLVSLKSVITDIHWDSAGLVADVATNSEKSSHNSVEVGPDELAAMTVIGIFCRKFIICHHNRVIYAIDQHAAHERVNLEHLLDSLSEQIASQNLKQAMPIPVQMSLRGDLQEELRRWGWKVTQIRGQWTLHSVPIVAGAVLSEIQGLVEYIHDFESGANREWPQCILHALQTRACKKAIKFGDEMTNDQAQELVRMLARCKRPNHCAHGRTVAAPIHCIDHPLMTFDAVQRMRG
jgi:DNA mismatch repair ATPase MutL